MSGRGVLSVCCCVLARVCVCVCAPVCGCMRVAERAAEKLPGTQPSVLLCADGTVARTRVAVHRRNLLCPSLQ